MHFQTLLGISGETPTLQAVILQPHLLTRDQASNQSCGTASCGVMALTRGGKLMFLLSPSRLFPQTTGAISHSSSQEREWSYWCSCESFEYSTRSHQVFSDLTLRLLPCCPHFPVYSSTISSGELVDFSFDLLAFFKISVFWFISNVTERLCQQQAYSTY